MESSTTKTLLESKNGHIIEILERIEQIGQAKTSILLTGESGTGKEIFAQHIHNTSVEKEKPFIAINCSAIQENLLESEFFGHVKGAFTGAIQNKKGVFELASGGTLFLDEIGELPLHLQPKILRAIETGTIRPVGSEKEIAIDIRLISATNQDLENMIKTGRFREDLYYRINVIHFSLPPLRKRKEDLHLFINFFVFHFAERHAKVIKRIDQTVYTNLYNYSFPGNIRELRNIIDHAVVFSKDGIISNLSLPKSLRQSFNGASHQENYPIYIKGKNIRTVLSRHNGNISQAAKELGIHRSTMHRRIRKVEGLV